MAKKIYLKSNGDIAKDLNIKDSQVRKWKSQDKQDEELKGALSISKGNVNNQNNKKVNGKVESKDLIEYKIREVLETAEIADKQRFLMILRFIKIHMDVII